ncbi:Uridine nucleosidase 1 [Tulasnella sp. 418]|nr:Uridine nucleosidase 1 [Tulasnella sp. 418]
MGGGVGIGNRSSVAEFNILCDPEAAQIVLDAPVRKIMIPLNVTHTVLLTPALHYKMLDPVRTEAQGSLPTAASPLRHTLSTLLSFFAESYRIVFGFEDGPPLHDALTIAYVAHPELFMSKRYRVDCELGTGHAFGETIVDLYEYQKCDETSWGRNGKNCIVAQSVKVHSFFELFFDAIRICEAKTS